MVSQFILALLFLFSKHNVFIATVEGGGNNSSGLLSYNYYEKTCPEIEKIVRDGVMTISISDQTIPSALLRLMFHDCQVQGCDASILLDPTDAKSSSEMDSPSNFGIKNREMISQLKSMVDKVCPQQVSCADILILAASNAVSLSGGPRILVPLGRKDSFTPPDPELATSSLPPASLGVEGALAIFATKGMSLEESVAIMGAHTLGVTHCRNIHSQRLDTMLILSCPIGPLAENISIVSNDLTPLIFDNQYYINALDGRGTLTVDAKLPLDQRTAPFVQLFAADQSQFFKAFSSAFVKLSSFGVLTGDQGVVREECSLVRT